MVEEVAVHLVGMQSCPGQPGAQCSFFDLKYPLQSRYIHSFCHQGQDQRHFGRRCLQSIKGGSPTHTELSATGLTAQILDAIGLAVPTISNQGVDAFVPNAKIVAILVWAGISLGGVSFLSSARAFHLRPGLEHLPREEDLSVFLCRSVWQKGQSSAVLGLSGRGVFSLGPDSVDIRITTNCRIQKITSRQRMMMKRNWCESNRIIRKVG